MEKQCTRCLEVKPESSFSRHKGKKDGLESSCKKCKFVQNKTHRLNNMEDYRKRAVIHAKKWRTKNPEKQKAIMKKRTEKRNKTVSGRLTHTISTKMSKTLHGEKCSRHWETLIGYNAEQLKRHLEKQFTPEMSWDNYGPYWHIDHKIPVSAFNYTKPEDIDFKKCWSLKNLRPLSAVENWSKNDKLLNPFQPSLAI
jgi:hypothetical protein